MVLGPRVAVFGRLRSVLEVTEGEDRAEHPGDYEALVGDW